MTTHPTKSTGAFPAVAMAVLLLFLTFVALTIRSCVKQEVPTLDNSTVQSK